MSFVIQSRNDREVDVQDQAGGPSNVSAIEEALDCIKDLRIEARKLQHALDRGKHAEVIFEDNYPFPDNH